MKQIVRFGLLLMLFSAFTAAAYAHPIPIAQKDQTAHLRSRSHTDHTDASVQIFTEGSGTAHRHSGTTIHVRKYKPRSTQRTRMNDASIERTSSNVMEGTKSSARMMTKRNAVSRLIVPEADLKQIHTINEQKILSIFNQYRIIFKA
jgi:hypothetical protein